MKAAKTNLANVLTGILVICAVAVTIAVVQREFFGSVDDDAEAIREIEVPEDLFDEGLWLGPKDAAVVAVEFSDFQCPYCGVAAQTLREWRLRYGDEVAVLYRHYPMSSIHPHAMEAAVAAECAGAQDSFERFHDVLFADQESIGRTAWSEFAERAGVPSITQFSDCLEEDWPMQRVMSDLRASDGVGVRSTPTVIVGDKLIIGIPLREALEAETALGLGRSTSSPAG